MADSATHRQNLSFSAAEKVLQEQPYIYSSATVTLSEKSVGSVFYQAWADGRVESKNVDVISLD
jgi:hypothetical protein